MKETDLTELGLTELESRAYLKVLKNPLIRSGELAKKLEAHRVTCYDILKRLEEKGLVSRVIKDKTILFQALDPEQMMNLLNQQEEILKQKKKNFSEIIKELKKVSDSNAEKTNIEFFEGLEGIKKILNRLVSKKKKDYKVLGQGIEWLNFSENYVTNYYAKKKENKVFSKAVIPNKPENKKSSLWGDKMGKRKFIENQEYKGTIAITSEEVSYFSFEGNDFKGFIIKNKDFAKMQEILFDNLWKSAKS